MRQLLARLTSIWLDFATCGFGPDKPRTYLRRVKFINALSIFGIIFLFGFGTIRLTTGHYMVGMVDVLLGAILISNLVFLRVSGNVGLVSNIGITGLMGLITFLFVTGGVGGTGIFWCYFLPVTAFFLLGVRGGIVWVAVLYLNVLSLYGFSALGSLRLYYTFVTTIQMLASLLLEAVMVLYYARVMETEEAFIEEHNRKLSESNQILNNEIAQRKKAEEELLRISYAVRSSSDAIVITDVAGRHLYHNRAFLQLFKYTVSEVNQSGGSYVLYGDPQLSSAINQTLKAGTSWSGEVPMRTKDRKYLSAFQRSDVIRDHGGAIVGFVNLFTDITSKKDTERLQSALYQISEKTNSAQDLSELFYNREVFRAAYAPAA